MTKLDTLFAYKRRLVVASEQLEAFRDELLDDVRTARSLADMGNCHLIREQVIRAIDRVGIAVAFIDKKMKEAQQ